MFYVQLPVYASDMYKENIRATCQLYVDDQKIYL